MSLRWGQERGHPKSAEYNDLCVCACVLGVSGKLLVVWAAGSPLRELRGRPVLGTAGSGRFQPVQPVPAGSAGAAAEPFRGGCGAAVETCLKMGRKHQRGRGEGEKSEEQ